MEDLKRKLEKRKEYLQKLKKEKENALKKAPEGAVRICSANGRVQYYHRLDSKDKNGIYMRSADIKKVRKLAQKDYDAKVLRGAETELQIIEKFLAHYPETTVEQIYENQKEERRKLILSIRASDEEFVAAWESYEYQGGCFYDNRQEHYTAKGERVRSKSEIIIADALYREGIPYRYEAPVYLKGVGEVYTDFTILNVRLRKEFYWEHFGRMDDPDYTEKLALKMNSYVQNGIFPGENLIITLESQSIPLNQNVVKELIHRYLI